ncbi:Abi family protein [Pseudoalteromonas sp. 5Ae-yellow]|uniref:Abi family protein n=1 Tax=Pseudoalteromonas sp. 5Ae-yellow TaxID=2759847 RepID=UPI0015F73563|nr:Abi family protein [Pseudoalteromonas sp. 5Ae-yellow]MBA6408959.1 Abi family protein [Pseudoalteromonas sp. 5Ae-yellow]
MIPFFKPSISLDEQIALLQQRGLSIKEPERAKHYLEVISFFRLSAYMRPFQKLHHEEHPFNEGSEFKQVVALYAFDRELRLLIMDAVERIEVATRSMFNNVMGPKYQKDDEPYSGSHWYIDRNHFNRNYDHNRLIKSLSDKQDKERGILAREAAKINNSPQHTPEKKAELINLKQRENYCRYYVSHYNEPNLPPCWAVIEELTLGELSHLYKGLVKDSDRKAIAKRFNVPQDKFASWLHTLTFIRNCCAHHARLWNRELPIAPKLLRDAEWQLPPVLPNSHIQPAKRLYSVLLLLAHLMKEVSPDSQWTDKLVQLIVKHPEVPVRNMGFPENWATHPFWALKDDENG